jgi:hypothetical protein
MLEGERLCLYSEVYYCALRYHLIIAEGSVALDPSKPAEIAL